MFLAETATLIRMRDKTARGHRLAVRVASSILRQQSAILQNVALPIYKRLCRSFGIIQIICSVLSTARALPSWKDSTSPTPSLSITTLTSIAESFGCLARNGRTCACHAFNYLIPTMDSIIEAIANRLRIRLASFNRSSHSTALLRSSRGSVRSKRSNVQSLRSVQDVSG